MFPITPITVTASELRSIHFEAPVQWASYYINNDASGLDEHEVECADKFLAHVERYIKVHSPEATVILTDCEDEASFSWGCKQKFGVDYDGCDIIEYQGLILDGEPS